MNIKFQLVAIQKILGLSQEEMAKHLGVSFVTLNSWINERSQPHSKTSIAIYDWYQTVTGEKRISPEEIEKKTKSLLKKADKVGPFLKLLLSQTDLRDTFALSLTYHSNKIEGSTLTENETAVLLFENQTLPNRTLSEQLEAKNHQTAFDWLLQSLEKGEPVDENFILRLHTILMNGIRNDAGSYRNHGVRIVGTHVPTANPLKVPALMETLALSIKNTKSLNFIELAEIHASFEKIHPFSDGNGRVGRLILHALLLQQGLPPAHIRQEDRRRYFLYLQKAQLDGDPTPLATFLQEAVEQSYTL